MIFKNIFSYKSIVQAKICKLSSVSVSVTNSRQLCSEKEKFSLNLDRFLKEGLKEVEVELPVESAFSTLFRQSKFVSLGQADGKLVVGRITQVVSDDLYIDFGGKFECVCKTPKQDSEKYRTGTEVLIRLHDLELSSRFLGTDKDLTLLEADATLIGLNISRSSHKESFIQSTAIHDL
ncbi:28S ribosomal protein S28, mitochondrial [Trichinella papuae]|uniref:28S ribosomal protein S28, mitochondrial n=1 Tax=Trichinella papuae TaxID=268474 RepID=A0A0V1MNM5_9BILA|nr:28S ribosomal protein S28, mitochondrial [Trichinella papuae]KRZ73433.1 28S ribosomal protein S28, mitochondrial [Trichinella papuae]